MLRNVFVALLVIASIQTVSAAKILILTNFCPKSFLSHLTPLAKGLSIQGHSVTFIHPYKPSTSFNNITEVTIPHLGNIVTDAIPQEIFGGGFYFVIKHLWNIRNEMPIMCSMVYENPTVQKAINHEDTYDLVILVPLMSECLLGIAHKINTPFIYVSPIVLLPFWASNLRVPQPASHVPAVLPFTDKMNFPQRVMSFLVGNGLSIMRMLSFPDDIIRDNLGTDVPSFNDIEKNVSLVLVNSHPSVDNIQPRMPNVIDVGGLHCRKPERLPKVGEE